MSKEKNYRPNVAAIVLSPKYPHSCEILIANRNDMTNDIWQFPQGGIDPDESERDALFRELKEEIGTDEIEIIAEYPQWLSYDFPKRGSNQTLTKLYPFDGQKQKYFLVRLKQDGIIDLNTKEPEFIDYKFVAYTEIFEFISHMKKPIYKQVLDYFRKNGYIS